MLPLPNLGIFGPPPPPSPTPARVFLAPFLPLWSFWLPFCRSGLFFYLLRSFLMCAIAYFERPKAKLGGVGWGGTTWWRVRVSPARLQTYSTGAFAQLGHAPSIVAIGRRFNSHCGHFFCWWVNFFGYGFIYINTSTAVWIIEYLKVVGNHMVDFETSPSPHIKSITFFAIKLCQLIVPTLECLHQSMCIYI